MNHDVHDTREQTRTTAAGDHQQARLPAALCVLLGVAAALVGLLPWLVSGARLPLQNLWATETRPEQMPHVLLPFSQYAVVLVIAVLVTGAAVAGLGARLLRSRLPRRGVLAVAAGVLLVQVTALVQTATVVGAGLSERQASTVYLVGLVVVAVLSVLVGVVALTLTAVAPPAGAVVGLSVGALALGPWLSGLAFPFGSVATSPVSPALLAALRWAPAVLVGITIGWAGLRSAGRVAAALVGLLLLWVVPALTAGLVNAGGSRVLARYPAEMVRYAVEVVVAALTAPAIALPPLVVAAVVAAAVVLGDRLWPRRQPAVDPKT